MPAPLISLLPVPPSRQGPANFALRADNFLLAFPTLQSEINSFADYINTNTIINYQFADGTVTAPTLNFQNDTDTGLYRIGENNIGVAAGGSKILDIATTGLGVTGTLSVSGAATLNGAGTKLTVSGTGSTFVVSPATAGSLNNIAIGGTTAAAGSFTTLSATGAATLNGAGTKLTVSGTGSTFSVSPATAGTLNNTAIGGTTAAAGSFTKLAYSAEGTTTSTSGFQVPVGSTAQRPTGANGKIRYNTTISQYEGFSVNGWESLATNTPEAISLFYKKISISQVISSEFNALSAGPIQVSSGTTITVQSGATWSII